MISLPDTYEASRARFRNSLAAVQKLWPAARLESHSLAGEEQTIHRLDLRRRP